MSSTTTLLPLPLPLPLPLHYSSLDFVWTTWVSWYQKKHSPTHTDRGHKVWLKCVLIMSAAAAAAAATTTTTTHNCFTALLDFVRNYPGEPAPER